MLGEPWSLLRINESMDERSQCPEIVRLSLFVCRVSPFASLLDLLRTRHGFKSVVCLWPQAHTFGLCCHKRSSALNSIKGDTMDYTD